MDKIKENVRYFFKDYDLKYINIYKTVVLLLNQF